ncbi:hypothetical protein KAR91_24910 [Candidatus Pacearchaeota archaeon]|nr:hypothetical protein [Candidatus Pacearchaeota archaeon]
MAIPLTGLINTNLGETTTWKNQMYNDIYLGITNIPDPTTRTAAYQKYSDFSDGIDSATTITTNLNTNAVDTTLSTMTQVNRNMMNNCGANIMAPVNDLFDALMAGVSAIGEGLWYGPLSAIYDSIVAIVSPIWDWFDANILSALDAFFGPIFDFIGDIVSGVGDFISGIGDFVSSGIDMTALQEIMTQALAMLGGLLNCGATILGAVDAVNPDVLALNPIISNGLTAVNHAKSVSTDPSDVMQEAQSKMSADMEFDTQAAAVQTSMDSANSIFI